MKYVAKSYEGIYYMIISVDNDYEKKDENEIIFESVEEAENFPIPCKLENGEYVHADLPESIFERERDVNKERVAKINWLSEQCNINIISGIDVETTAGVEHFSLEETDQINLTTASNSILLGAETYPYHADNKLCRNFTAKEIQDISNAAISHKTYNLTLCNHLMEWARRAESVNELDKIHYSTDGMPDDLMKNMNLILYGNEDGNIQEDTTV